jgi:hypothetical protein
MTGQMLIVEDQPPCTGVDLGLVPVATARQRGHRDLGPDWHRSATPRLMITRLGWPDMDGAGAIACVRCSAVGMLAKADATGWTVLS